MLRRIRIAAWSLLALYLLAACGSSAGPDAPAASRATAAPPAPATAAPATARPAPATQASQPTTQASQPTAAGQADGLSEGVTAEGYHMLGNPNAPVTLTMYSDFLWSACAFHVVETEPQIVSSYIASGQVKLVYRHLLQLGDGSLRTGEASECAADQGKFWPMRQALYARQSEVYGASDLDATLTGFAKDLGMDTGAFGSCMQSHKHQQFVQDDYQAAVAAGVQFRPAFDINGAKLTGALPFAAFKKQIESALPK